MKFAIIVIIAVSIFLIIGISIAQKDSQQTPNKSKEIIGKDGAKMVLIPAGEFQMGTDLAEIPGLIQWVKGLYPDADVKADWFKDETPRHTVYLDAFYMDKYEVTNAQYRKFVQATGRSEPEGIGVTIINGVYFTRLSYFCPWSDKNYKDYKGDQQPVVCVSYEDAKAYAEWAGKRLPTEAEWEKAARGGLVGKKYPWGDDWPPPSKAGNFPDEALERIAPIVTFVPSYNDGYPYTAPVGSFNPNGYGLYDMAGNVQEWCDDWYEKDYYGKSPKQNPKGFDSGESRVLRGGSFLGNAVNLRTANRTFNKPTPPQYIDLGFRCVASATP